MQYFDGITNPMRNDVILMVVLSPHDLSHESSFINLLMKFGTQMHILAMLPCKLRTCMSLRCLGGRALQFKNSVTVQQSNLVEENRT